MLGKEEFLILTISLFTIIHPDLYLKKLSLSHTNVIVVLKEYSHAEVILG